MLALLYWVQVRWLFLENLWRSGWSLCPQNISLPDPFISHIFFYLEWTSYWVISEQRKHHSKVERKYMRDYIIALLEVLQYVPMKTVVFWLCQQFSRSYTSLSLPSDCHVPAILTTPSQFLKNTRLLFFSLSLSSLLMQLTLSERLSTASSLQLFTMHTFKGVKVCTIFTFEVLV